MTVGTPRAGVGPARQAEHVHRERTNGSVDALADAVVGSAFGRRVVAERVRVAAEQQALDPEPPLDDEPEFDAAAAGPETAVTRDPIEQDGADEAESLGTLAPAEGPGGFWRAPRRLRRLLEDGQVTAKGYALVHYVGESHGDRDGISTTLATLAALLDLSTKQTRRTLDRLVALDLVEHDLRAGRATFRIRLGRDALYSSPEPRTALRTLDSRSNVRSEVLGDLRHPSTRKPGKPASGSGATSDTTSDISRARAETETETERTPLTPQRGERRRRTPQQRRTDRFAAELHAEPAATWQTLDPDTRATIADAYGRSTGLRYRRGTHGTSWTPDPLGDDPRPIGSEASALPPDWHGRANPAEYLQAWLERARPEMPA